MKKIKMLLYGEPGVGKSVFACKFPKPIFITTDGNYEWLEDFGAKPEDHFKADSWAEFVKFINSADLTNYDTIVIDLLEDLFKWCEYEYLVSNKLDHPSDVGYGKAYDITRNSFFIEISKLINKDKNIIFLTHENILVTKDRRGIEKHSFKPSDRIPDKVLDRIEGRLRFVIRAYFQDVEDDGKLMQKRMLSIVPKSNEYGIIRGVNVDIIPGDIPLSASEFISIIEQYSLKTTDVIVTVPKAKIGNKGKVEVPVAKTTETPIVKDKVETVKVEPVKVETVISQPEEVQSEVKAVSADDIRAKIAAKIAANKASAQQEQKDEVVVKTIEKDKGITEAEPEYKAVVNEVEKTVKIQNDAPVTKELTKEEKLAMLKAKFEKIKKKGE